MSRKDDQKLKRRKVEEEESEESVVSSTGAIGTLGASRGHMFVKERTEITRPTTEEEKANIKGINFSEAQMEEFLKMARKGLVEAVAVHEGAVQDNMALRAEISVSLSRPVRDSKTGEVTRLEGNSTRRKEIIAEKVYHDKGLAQRLAESVEEKQVTEEVEGATL